jgi:O-antigen/teichoic acid export membrane protein
MLAIAVVGGSTSVYSFAVGRWLGDITLGHASLALAVGLGVAQVTVSGLGAAITRFTALLTAAGTRSAAGRALEAGLVTACLVGAGAAALAFATAPAWAPAVGLPGDLVGPAAVLIALQSAYIAAKAGLYGRGRVGAYARVETVAGIAFAALLALLVLRLGDRLLLPFIGANMAFLALAIPALRRAPSVEEHGVRSAPIPAGLIRSMGGYAAIATVGNAAALARLSLAPLLTGASWPAAEVGLLQAGLSFFMLVMLVPRALELAVFPALAAAHGRDDPRGFKRQVEAALAFTAVALGLVGGTLLAWGDGPLLLIYGQGFADAAGALTWVLVSGWCLGLAVPAVAALSGAEGVAVPNAAAVAGLVVSLAAWVVLIPAAGATGAALGLAAGSLVTAGLPLVEAARRFGLDMAAPARIVATSVALLAGTLVATRVTELPDWAGAAAYATVFAALQRDSLLRLADAR